jgi:hypothetical protein
MTAPADAYTTDKLNFVWRKYYGFATAALAADTFVASGYITSTSAGATTITLPTAATMSVQLGAVAGQEYSFIVNNTAGASNVTIALGTGGTLSDAATITASAVAFGRLVVAAGATGMAKFTLMFTGGDGVTPLHQQQLTHLHVQLNRRTLCKEIFGQ